MTNIISIDPAATGARIRDTRKAMHITVEAIVEALGLATEQTVYKWQRGDSLPEYVNLLNLSKMFGVTINYLLGGEEGEITGGASPL